MIRVVGIAALLCLLVLVLYLPSAHLPERFLAQVRTEHQAMQELWGEEPASRILDRALSLRGPVREATPVPPSAAAAAANDVDGVMAQEMDSVNQRLFQSSYFRAIDALLLLAAFRASALLEWLPWVGIAALVSLADGAVVRFIKVKEFRLHDPEFFALFAGLAVTSVCATVMALVIPATLPPMLIPAVLVGIAALAAIALGNFHRQA